MGVRGRTGTSVVPGTTCSNCPSGAYGRCLWVVSTCLCESNEATNAAVVFSRVLGRKLLRWRCDLVDSWALRPLQIVTTRSNSHIGRDTRSEPVA